MVSFGGRCKKMNWLRSFRLSDFCPTFAVHFVSVAQLVEQLTLNQRVQSSSLCGNTKKDRCRFMAAVFFMHNRSNLNRVSVNVTHDSRLTTHDSRLTIKKQGLLPKTLLLQ